MDRFKCPDVLSVNIWQRYYVAVTTCSPDVYNIFKHYGSIILYKSQMSL